MDWCADRAEVSVILHREVVALEYAWQTALHITRSTTTRPEGVKLVIC